VVSLARAEDSPPAETPRFTEYQTILNEYLVVLSKPGQALDSQFDYERFYDDRGRYEKLSRARRQLLSVPPSRMSESARLAWAINTYNFLVLENATNYLLVPKRGRLRWKSVQDMKLPTGFFFKGELVEVEGQKYSLNDFEIAFCFGGWDRMSGVPVPPTVDPRVHFALVCGAMGCPPLLPRAYEPDSLERQLDYATRNALRLPRHLDLDTTTGRVGVSTIFNWYQADFGGHEGTWAFVKRYAPPTIRAFIEKRALVRPGRYVPWDWGLNQIPHKSAS
jgi:hypothetical protein